MKKIRTVIATLLISAAGWAHAIEVGKPAPDFRLPGLTNPAVSLSQYKGKTVVLEWVNEGCPFVHKHYGSGNLQSLQKKYTAKGVIWLSIASSGEGKEGYWPTSQEAAAFKAEQKASMTDLLLDPAGTVGHLYEAKTTPHMYVIDAKGLLVYAGAIDDKASTNPKDIAKAKNWVAQALDEVLAKKKVTVPETRAYGCGVKYKN